VHHEIELYEMQLHDLAAQISQPRFGVVQKLTEGMVVEIPTLSTKIGASYGSDELCTGAKTY